MSEIAMMGGKNNEPLCGRFRFGLTRTWSMIMAASVKTNCRNVRLIRRFSFREESFELTNIDVGCKLDNAQRDIPLSTKESEVVPRVDNMSNSSIEVSGFTVSFRIMRWSSDQSHAI